MQFIQQKLIQGLPAGYTSTITQPEDAEQIAKMWAAVGDYLGQTRQYDPNEIRSDWETPDYHLQESSRCVRNEDGDVVGYLNLWDNANPPLHPHVSFGIHPDHFDAGIGEPMLQWAEARARQAIDRCPPEVRVSMLMSSNLKNQPIIDTMESYGLKAIRYFFRMIINMTEAPPKPQLPEGYIIRPMKFPEELEATIRADDAGFKDHWGYMESSWEDLLKEWNHHVETDKYFDPDLWFLAIEEATGEIAGISLCRNEAWAEPSLAYVMDLCVLREHRKKGLALALLHHSFGEFWQRGRKDVALHVDGSSLTGAVRLYERAGMHQDETTAQYELLLREGEELMTTAIDQKD
ncbi:GNAT family N-acetyltransferase [Phototrophicus methaneseepsis]|uniref:GNAT family N-acetyltransferase n=1 Tax=Phototrophicus methaneseepsis TaxID=2710758 RepID=A0A7S8ID76_9CHLR|nr:GNAT family N-acetyltransferase [Phototrophicus methaneseepsis]QPC82290.1 GNAT family N-acetyltransferase [Phototrophicus methaneseepsis]